MQMTKEQMVDDYEEKLNEATEGIYVNQTKICH
jgi:hypothetical protein